MREYGKIAPTFWTRGSGRKIRGDANAQVVALYLMTAPGSNMIGIYYLALATVAHETGLSIVDVESAMARLREADIAYYDLSTETVWVPNMPKYQIGPELKNGDKRVHAVRKELGMVGDHPFLWDFYRLYSGPYDLPKPAHIQSLERACHGLMIPVESPADSPTIALPEGSLPNKSKSKSNTGAVGAREDAPESAAASGENSDPELASIRQALAHESFVDVPDLDAVARDRRDKFETLRMSRGVRLEWFLAAISDAASDCAGTGLNSQTKVSTIRRYTHNPKPPKTDGPDIPGVTRRETPEEIFQRKNREAQEEACR